MQLTFVHPQYCKVLGIILYNHCIVLFFCYCDVYFIELQLVHLSYLISFLNEFLFFKRCKTLKFGKTFMTFSKLLFLNGFLSHQQSTSKDIQISTIEDLQN